MQRLQIKGPDKGTWHDWPIWSWVFTVWGQRILLAINIPGVIYGFWWYKHQLLDSPWWQWPLIPDSPLAAADFTLLLFLGLIGASVSWLNCLAPAVLVKYGVWAVILNLHVAYLSGEMSLENWMLTLSHLGMALQAFLFWPKLEYDKKTWLLVSCWIFFNDGADYLGGIHPYLFDDAQFKIAWISALTLSFLVTILGFVYVKKNEHKIHSFN